MSKPWQPYALDILDAISKIRQIQTRGNITQVSAVKPTSRGLDGAVMGWRKAPTPLLKLKQDAN